MNQMSDFFPYRLLLSQLVGSMEQPRIRMDNMEIPRFAKNPEFLSEDCAVAFCAGPHFPETQA
jgi:hypothetical protein